MCVQVIKLKLKIMSGFLKYCFIRVLNFNANRKLLFHESYKTVN